jgi:hypothetical protein
MRIDEGELHRLADSVVRALVKQGFVRLRVSEKQVAERIVRLLLDNLRAEQAIERDAEQLAEKLGRKVLEMDRHKIINGIKVRLAKERGFTL